MSTLRLAQGKAERVSGVEPPLLPWQGSVITTIRHPPAPAVAGFEGQSPQNASEDWIFVPWARLALATLAFSELCSTT